MSAASAKVRALGQALQVMDGAADYGVLSLREAILTANDGPGLDTITFAENIRGGTIVLTDDLPTITDDLVIDGDPLDRGAGGIIIDGGLGGTDVGSYTNAFTANGVDVSFEDLTIQNTYSVGIVAAASNTTLDRVEISEIKQPEYGGTGLRGDGSLQITDSVIRSIGIAETSFGVMFSGDVNLERSAILDIFGGFATGLEVTGDVRIVDSTFAGINGNYSGEAIDVEGSLAIENSSFIGNGTLNGFLSPITVVGVDGNLSIINSTFADNASGLPHPYSPSDPRATIYLAPGNTGSIVNTTVSGTRNVFSYSDFPSDPPIGTGLLVAPTSTLTISNSIIDDSIEGTITSNGANTFRDLAVSGAAPDDALGVRAEQLFALTEEIGTSGVRAGGVRAGVAADNGGPTQTVALLDDPTNPALDAADPADAPATDQRGFLRDASPDIGAFELGGTVPPEAPPLPDLGEKVPLADADILGVPRSFLTLVGGDAEIGFVNEFAAFQSSLGVYLVGPDGLILNTAWAFERVEHAEPSDLASAAARPGGGPLAPGDAVLFSDLFDPAELAPGVEFGLFLVADGWSRNDEAVFDGGSLAFRSGDGPAAVTDRAPELFHISEDGTERLVLGDIMHTVDAGSPNPLSNVLNPGGGGQATSGLLDGAFTVAFEDKPLANSDRDFNDALFAVDLFDGGTAIADAAGNGAVDVQALLTEAEVA